MKENRNRVGIALAVSLVLSFLCGFAIYHSMGFVYAIADDVIMRDIASGAFTGTPDGHLIFMQYALGWCISRLYLVNPSVDWYGFFMAGVLFLGLSAVLYRGLAARKSFRWKAVYTGLALGISGTGLVFHAAQFEWTISAAVLGSCALYLYVTEPSEAGKGQRLLEEGFLWLLLALTYCIRYDVFFMVMPGFGVAFLWKFFRRQNGRFCIRCRELVLPAVVFLTVGWIVLTEQQAYQGEGWEEFQRFQSARSQVYDYTGVPSYEVNPAFFEELGLNEHEVRNLRHYALYLVDGMDAELMEALSRESIRQSFEAQGMKAKLKAGAFLALEQLTDSEYLTVSLPALLFLLGVLVLAFPYRKKRLLPLILFLGAEGVLWLGLGFLGRLPERVAFSMHLVLLMGLAGVCFRLWEVREENLEEAGRSLSAGHRRTLGNAVLLAGMAAFLVCAGLQWTASRKANEEKLSMDENYQLFKNACKDEADRLFFIETYAAEPVGGAKVTANGDFRLNRCLTLGDWYTTSPLDEERFQRLGIEKAETELLENLNAYLVVRDVEDPGFYKGYFEEKYPGCELVCREIKVIEDRTYYLYQIQR